MKLEPKAKTELIVDPSSEATAEDKEMTQAKIRAKIMSAPIPKVSIAKSSKVISSGSDHLYGQHQQRPSHWNILESVDSTPINEDTWVIQDLIPERKITLIAGSPGTGKTTLALAIAAATTQGRNHPLWNGLTTNGSGGVIISTTEDDLGGTIKKRFLAAGGNTKRFKNFNGIPAPHPSIAFYTRPSTFSDEDNEVLLNEAKKLGNLGLVVFDPASQVIRGSSSNSKDREGYEKLGQLSERLDCAILGIAHTPKSTKGKGIYARIAGSGAAGQVARSILMVEKIRGGPLADGATHVLVLAKAFGEPVNYGVTYSIVPWVITEDGIDYKTSKIIWHGTIPGTPEEILEWAESGNEVDGMVDTLNFAINFIREILRNGPVWSKEAERLAKAARITTRDLKEAKMVLGVRSKRREGVGQSSPFDWSLPPSNPK